MKPKKPKIAVIEDGHEARTILTEVRTHHQDLEAANIEMVWMLEEQLRHGQLVLGWCKIAPELWWRLAGIDIVVGLCWPWWAALAGQEYEAASAAKHYLIDHELCHATQKLDDAGHQVEDTTGRKIWQVVGHDLEDFSAPIRRYGPLPDALRFVKDAQLHLPLETRYGLRLVDDDSEHAA